MSGALILGYPDLFGHREYVACGTEEVMVSPIPKAQADDVIKRGHYSGSVVWSSSWHFGVFSRGQLVGALQYGPAMNPASGARIVAGAKQDEWLELNRMWLSDGKPSNCASRAISYSLRLLVKLKPSLRWVQSFADERCGKSGAVYQAASFLYCGSHRSTFYRLDGEWFHKSMLNRATVDKRGWSCGPKILRFMKGRDRVESFEFSQFRYVRLLDQRLRSRLLLPVLPYPKSRAHSVSCDMDDNCSCREAVAS